MRSVICLLFVVFSTVMCFKIPLPEVQEQKSKAKQPCVTPQVWESKLFEYIPSRNLTVLAKFSVDGVNQKMRVAEMINYEGRNVFYDVILLYQEKTMYVVHIKVNKVDKKVTRICTKHPLVDVYPESLVPSDAKYFNDMYIGTAAEPGAGLLVDVYSGVSNRTGVGYMMSVTNKLCIPVNMFSVVPPIGVVQVSFFDAVLGIEDPNRFVPPKECNKLEMKPVDPKIPKRWPRGPLV